MALELEPNVSITQQRGAKILYSMGSLSGNLAITGAVVSGDYVPLSPSGAELLFEVFSQRYELGSTIVISNLPFEDWTQVLGSERLTGALRAEKLWRLTHHVSILVMNGDSYRLKQSTRRCRRPPRRSKARPPRSSIPTPARSPPPDLQAADHDEGPIGPSSCDHLASQLAYFCSATLAWKPTAVDRRRWSGAERLRILTEAFSPGACVSEVARRHDVSTALIYGWQRKLWRELSAAPASSASLATSPSTMLGTSFAEAVLTDEPEPEVPEACSAIVIDLPGGVRVSIAASTPPAFAAALKALR